MRKSSLCFISLVLCGCVTTGSELSEKVILPDNVSLTLNNDGEYGYFDTVVFDYQLNKKMPFGKVAVCVAEKVESKEAVLQDSSASFVGAYTGNYYDIGSIKSYSGKNVFKHVDKETKTLIANGSAKFSKRMANVNLTRFVRYNLKAHLEENLLKIKFFNIEGAQQDSGSASNPGFSSVGNWKAAMPLETYNGLASTAEQIHACLIEE